MLAALARKNIPLSRICVVTQAEIEQSCQLCARACVYRREDWTISDNLLNHKFVKPVTKKRTTIFSLFLFFFPSKQSQCFNI
jgi:hypothetical protein